jgi:hypothetical protein
MAIIDIENAIIGQLKSSITDLKVEGFPENWNQYRLLHPKGAVLVQYTGSNYSSPELNFAGMQQQLKTLTFGIALLVKGLRDKSGAYSYIDSIIAALAGFEPAGCLAMYPVSDNFQAEEDGIFYYELRFNVPTENYL